LRQVTSRSDIERRRESQVAAEIANAAGSGSFRDAGPDFGSTKSDTPAPSPPPPPEKSDSYSDRLLKYIPPEVIALYLTLVGIVSASANNDTNALRWGVLGFCLVGTPLYLWRVAKVRKALQLIISTVGFAVWAFSLGQPFSSYGWYQPIYSALLLPAYTFLIPIVEV
jgi:hypothetical protein